MREMLTRTAIECPTELAMSVVGQKWKLVIMERLEERTWRFGELQRSLSGITARMLTRQLRELETDALVLRTVYTEVPPKVEYSMTELGRSLETVLAELRTWGEHYRSTLTGHEPRSPPATADSTPTPLGSARHAP